MKTTTLNLRVNIAVKERAEEVLSKIGVPMSTAINTNLMTEKELHAKLQKGYDDIASNRVQNASEAFKKFRETHILRNSIL